ncbi:MAG: hypothetical protein J5842_03825 [Lachnospiraceae bacterium]|nr:hypothetical protein [Lachnospiraceae bacterium]
MNRCPNCNIYLYSHPTVCPLCNSVTEELDEKEKYSARALFGMGAPYPDMHKKDRVLRFVLRLVLFIFLLAETVLVLINYLTSVKYPWSLITGVGLLYIYLFLLYWVRHDSGFAAKVGYQLFATQIFLFFIDYFNGFYGWSLQWAIPGIILLGDGIVFFLMMLNKSRWHSYLLLLLLMGICSLAILALYFTNVIHSIIMPLICTGVTAFYFLGTILFGGSSAGRELSRRFHV